MSSALLSNDAFLAVVRDAPLLSIDLIVEDETGMLLFGLRRNAPACGYWFVPGGRVRKSETLDQAFHRLCLEEIGLKGFNRNTADFLGVYEHFYTDNALHQPGFGTHYVVLAYRLRVDRSLLKLQDSQHEDYRWLSAHEAETDETVHTYSRAYLKGLSAKTESNSPMFKAMPSKYGRWLSLTTAVLLLLALFLGGSHPAAGSLFAAPWDKAAHIGMYFTLALLLREGLNGAYWRIALLVFLIGAVDEFHQLHLPTRHAEWADLIADSLGILLAMVFHRALVESGVKSPM